jgi:hypothetical protein
MPTPTTTGPQECDCGRSGCQQDDADMAVSYLPVCWDHSRRGYLFRWAAIAAAKWGCVSETSTSSPWAAARSRNEARSSRRLRVYR